MNEIYFKIAEKFGGKDMRTFARIINRIEKENLDPYKMRDYVAQFMAQKVLFQTPSKPCSICNGKMMLLPVNTGDRDQIGGDYKSQWWCGDCDESEFSEQSVEEEMKTRTL